MTLRSFIDETGVPDRTIDVVSDDATGPLERMLTETFAEQPVAVESDVTIPTDPALGPEIEDALETEGDTAVLFEDGRPVAASPMLELYDAILAINSDLFVTGARGVGEIELPAVLANLDETRLRLRGYPLSDKEKLLLIVVSRYIEQRAWATGSGTLRSGFQRLARIDDEVGTRDVYAELATTDVETHLYGIDDGATTGLDVTEHTGATEAHRNGWFVVYEPDTVAIEETPTAEPMALICLETEPQTWDGFWTYDPDRVAAIGEYVAGQL